MKWFAAGVNHLPVLDFDAATGTAWAQLLAELKHKGRAIPTKDSMLAATARQHKLTVAARNASDFIHAGVQVVNPFDS